MADLNDIIIRSQISRIESASKSAAQPKAKSVSGEAFESQLDIAEIRLSKHAQRRLDFRQIELSEADRSKLNRAVSTLEKKGARDSLVLMDEKAFIVNVPTRTVVTALTKEQMEEQVFTNIDSTLLIK